jgi:5-methylcytosine-specific restriction endonuclease McrA
MRSRRKVPAAVKRAVFTRANGRCERCGSGSDLHMHHVRYRDAAGRLIFGREQLIDLILLCASCHEKQHEDRLGLFWRNPSLKHSITGT